VVAADTFDAFKNRPINVGLIKTFFSILTPTELELEVYHSVCQRDAIQEHIGLDK